MKQAFGLAGVVTRWSNHYSMHQMLSTGNRIHILVAIFYRGRNGRHRKEALCSFARREKKTASHNIHKQRKKDPR
jgi:hypothetical protein